MPSLAACRGAADLLGVVKDALGSSTAGAGEHRGEVQWLLLVGARIEAWTSPGEGPSGWPTLRELDEVTGSVPCAAMSFDHHMVMANSAALAAANITAASIDPPGGIIARDSIGHPSGLLLETAAWNLWACAPEPTPLQRRAHVEAALADLHRHGFAQVHDMLSQPWLGQVLAELSDAGRLPLSVWLNAAMDEIHHAHQQSAEFNRPDVRLTGGKIFVDGTLNSRTAWMLAPYREPQPGMPTGKIVTSPAQIEGAIRACDAIGIGLAAHAIGDAAVRAVLDASQRVHGPHHAASTSPFRPARARSLHDVPALRIEHAEIIDAADIPRFAQLGVVASIQPCHLLTDIEALHRYLPHRLDRVLPLRSLIDAGCRPGELLWFGSDTPIVRPDPQDSIQAAVYRRREGMARADAIAISEAITQEQAWAAFEAPGRGTVPR